MIRNPTVGRIVHYWPSSGKAKGSPFPAMITNVWSDDCVNLWVFPDGTYGGQAGVVTSVRIWNGLGKPDGKNVWDWPFSG